VRISRGQLSRIIQKVSAALETAYKELIEKLPAQLKLNVDETGHKENGERFWTWCFRAEAFALIKISGSRGSDVLFETLGHEFGGVLGCDYFSAYRKYMKDCDVLVQFCLAHLIRDLRYLTTLRSPSTVAYGERLLEGMRQLFNLFHSRHALTEHGFVNALNHKREEIMALALDDVPTTQEAQNLAKRFRLHGEAYFRFITTPGVDPTNNLAEQAIRLVVIDRVVTQGTRSERGRTWCERIWTVMATCAQQGRSAFDYLCAAVRANFTNQPCPSLLPDPP
jgi:transposase